MEAHRQPSRARPLRPGSWPVRWRLALASAGLTLAILLVFGAMVGHFAGQRVRDDFDRELRDTAQTLASELSVVETTTGTYLISGPGLDDVVLPNDATVRVFDAEGAMLDESTGAVDLGPPIGTGLRHLGRMTVATESLDGPNGALSGYVQYARSETPVDSTIARIWLLVAVGVLAGTVLASLAGLAIADRAMRPVATLTAKAREVGATRDPSHHIPPPQTDDEVGELARTLEQMLRSLDAARTEREEAMQRQREFVADASHELRTPLTSVLANLELLEASLREDDAGRREAVASALRSSKRMTNLVGDLLLLARADAGRASEKSHCDLAEIARDAAAEISPMLGEHELSIDAAGSVAVVGSPEELHRMVVNLLDNAVRHTPSGSRIELRVSGNGEATVEVADDGPGIPADMREDVFDRFVRGTGSADRSTGTGLGLAIVRAVARSHGGTAEVMESEAGGALFRVRLPGEALDLDHDRQDHRATA